MIPSQIDSDSRPSLCHREIWLDILISSNFTRYLKYRSRTWLEEIAGEYAGKIDVYKIDVDKEPELAAAFGVQSIPTLLFCPMKNQPQIATGFMDKATLQKAIKEVLLVK